MPRISRAALYAFEQAATARDRMPTAAATGGRVYSSFTNSVPKGAVWWWTNDRGDLRMFRSNPINVILRLQETVGATVDNIWGSQTRTLLMQYGGLSDSPSAPVPMRQLLETVIAKDLTATFGPGSVIIPQKAEFPPIDSPRGTEVGGTRTDGDNLLYWDGSRGVFQPTQATTPATNAPPTGPITTNPAEPPPAPPVARRGRIAIVVRPTLPEGSENPVWSDAHANDPLTLVEQVRLPDRMRIVADGPDGLAVPFAVQLELSYRSGPRAGTQQTYTGTLPVTFRGDVQQNIEATWDVTNGLRLASSVTVPLNAPTSDGATPAPLVQEAGMFGSVGKTVLVMGAVTGVLYLFDKTRPPAQRWFRPA